MLVAFFMISVVFTGCLENDDNGDNNPDHHDDEPGLHHHGDGDYHHDHDGDDDHTHEESDRHHSHDEDSGDNNAPGEGEGCMDYDDLNENGAYDSDEPCHDEDSGDNNAPGEGEGCIDYDDLNENGAYDSDEPCHDDEAAVSHNISVNSLEDVFNNMNEDGEYYYTKEEWVIHDISEIVEIDGMLMFGVTGKAQEDGYNCGLETWYIFPSESTFTPGQCLLSEKPSWHAEYVPSNDGALWAPNFLGNRTMYYTVPMSNEDSHEDTQSCIGMITATGTAPDLVWTDHDEPILCQIEGEENNDDPEPPALDPAIFIDDDGKMYMVYGGAHIWITELDPATGEHISGDPLSWDNGDSGEYIHVANGPSNAENDGDPWIEAPYIHKEEDWYYLFVNWYDCCQGVDSTYEIVVGRSESVTGPYLDETGTNMLEDGGTLVIAHESHDIIGPGHAGIFEYGTGDNKVQVFTHHYYPDDGTPWAYAQARTLTWDSDGWPVISQEQWDPMDYWGSTDDEDIEEENEEETEQNHDVSITDNMQYNPEDLTINVGDTVTWTNNDGGGHTATSTSGPESFDSGNIASGGAWSFTFTEAGTYDYKCDYHSSMTATITVND